MSASLTKEQRSEIIVSLQRYTSKELDLEIGDIQAAHLLDYVVKEIGPFAYNQGVEGAKAFIAAKVEEVTGTCFEQGLTYWKASSGARQIRRKP